MNLRLLAETVAVCRLGPGSPVPTASGPDRGFFSFTRTAGGLSVVCAEDQIPPGARHESGWRILEVEGPLDFALTGILLSIARPLAEAGVPIFALSTFDTDYVLVREADLGHAWKALEAAGHCLSAARP